MEEAARSPLVAWESFYVIVGSSGAALTGLQFVVIALIAESRTRTTARQIDAFGTPTIVHFCAVLLISAILSAPWHGLSRVSLALGACGFTGVMYGLIVIKRARSQAGYRPVFEDWLWHAALPLIAYALLLVGATAVLLLFIGIHNAWDSVTYISIGRLETPGESEEPKGRSQTDFSSREE